MFNVIVIDIVNGHVHVCGSNLINGLIDVFNIHLLFQRIVADVPIIAIERFLLCYFISNPDIFFIWDFKSECDL